MPSKNHVDLRATHECFDDSFQVALELMRSKKCKPEEVFIVHGLLDSETHKNYAHAWVEYRGEYYETWFLGSEKVVSARDKSSFLTSYSILECRKYPLSRVFKVGQRNKNISVGPWYRPFRLQCREYRLKTPF